MKVTLTIQEPCLAHDFERLIKRARQRYAAGLRTRRRRSSEIELEVLEDCMNDWLGGAGHLTVLGHNPNKGEYFCWFEGVKYSPWERFVRWLKKQFEGYGGKSSSW